MSDSTLQPIERINVVEESVERITAYILGQRLEPGDRLPPEREFAASFRVGRSTIREAIKALRAVGVVEVTPRGPVVGRGQPEGLSKSLAWGLLISERGAHEALEAREAVEPALARLAAERATDDELAEIGRALAEMRRLRGTTQYVDADLQFHALIARAARNSLLLSVTETLREVIRTWMTKNIAEEKKTSRSNTSYREHKAIYDALLARDGPGAAAAMHKHLTAAGKRLLTAIRRTVTETNR